MHQITHWVNGQSTALNSHRSANITNPATGEVTATVLLAELSDVDQAVAVAKDAFAGWANTSVSKRTRVMFAYRELLEAHKMELAELVAAEHGKVRLDALGEVTRGIEVVEYACGIGSLLQSPFSENVSTAVDTYTLRQPIGVVAGITPFNFPAMVPMWMYPVAIACGNTFVLKPSEKDPSVSQLMARLFTEAGLPDGVFNVVHGDALAVNALLEHKDIEAVSFVGSTPIARHIYESSSKSGKRVQALGGAKNHMIVLPDADIGQAADAAVSAGYGSAGERCMAISVVVAVGDVGDRIIPEITARIDKLKVGPGLSEEEMDMGALVTAEHRDKVVSYIDAGEQQGATLVVDGRGYAPEGHENGFWVGPTLFDDVSTDMSIYTDEIFGPVLCVVRVDTYDQALALINDSPYGNGTAIFTNDGGAARHFRSNVKAGMVGVNVPIPVPLAFHSFGGWKDSLFGDTHAYGAEGIKFYTLNKVVTERWLDPNVRGVDLGFPANS